MKDKSEKVGVPLLFSMCICFYNRKNRKQVCYIYICCFLKGVCELWRFMYFKYFGIFRLISVFQTTAMLKFANSQHYTLAPFAKFIGSLIRLS